MDREGQKGAKERQKIGKWEGEERRGEWRRYCKRILCTM